MTVTAERLVRGSAACAAASGALFVAVQVKHPHVDLDFVGTTEYAVRQTAKVLMAALALAGTAGLYLRQVRRVGVLGLVGYVVLSLGYLGILTVETIATFVLPSLKSTSPQYAQDLITTGLGGSPVGDIGAMPILFGIAGAGYILGGLVFGIALVRSNVVARWASLLLAAATTSTAALAVVPESFNRPLAVPTGIALIGLGWSSWRTPLAQEPAQSRDFDVERTAA